MKAAFEQVKGKYNVGEKISLSLLEPAPVLAAAAGAKIRESNEYKDAKNKGPVNMKFMIIAAKKESSGGYKMWVFIDKRSKKHNEPHKWIKKGVWEGQMPPAPNEVAVYTYKGPSGGGFRRRRKSRRKSRKRSKSQRGGKRRSRRRRKSRRRRRR